MADSLHRALVVEANERFWAKTHYKPGQRLSKADPTDRKMMPVWMEIYREVLREHATPLPQGPQKTTPLPPPASPTPVLTPEPPIVPAASPPPSPSSFSGMKVALILGGMLAVGTLGTFLYKETRWYRVGMQIQRSSRAARRV